MKYPYFGKSEFGIVLFTAPEQGICIQGIKNTSSFKLGQTSYNWGEENFEAINILEIRFEDNTTKMFSAKEANELRESFLTEPFDWVSFKEVFKKHIQENPNTDYFQYDVKMSQSKEFQEKMTDLGYSIEVKDNTKIYNHFRHIIRY